MKTLASRRTHNSIQQSVLLTVLVTFFTLICGPGLFGQSGAGSIQGTITDPTGAVIAQASIHVVNRATGVAVDTRSNGVGFYKVPGLFTGTYALTVTAKGMKSYETSIELLVDQHATINPALTAGSVTQQVVVSSNAIQLVTKDSGTLSSTLENARINQLPMNGRSLLNLLPETTPGVVNHGNGLLVNGMMGQAFEFVEDGAPMINRNFGGEANSTQGQLPDPDAVQEVKMDMADSGAEFSTPMTGIITTKSGTNSLHGSLFETARNAAFGVAKPRGFISTPSAPANPPLVRNEFGFSAGGPLVIPHVYHGKDKTFWFGAYERFSLSTWKPMLISVPTQAMKNGDFSGLKNGQEILQQLYDPTTTQASNNCNNTGLANPYCRTPFQGNQIPLQRLSPFSKIIYDILPNPTTDDDPLVTGNLQAHNFTYNVIPTVTFRLDHSFNEKNHAYLRYTDVLESNQGLRNSPNNAPLTVAADGIPAAASGGTQWLIATFSASAGFTHIFSPSFFSETVLSQEWFNQNDVSIGDPNLNYESIFGTPNNFGETGFPQITGNILGLTGTQWNYREAQIITNLDENLTKTIGRHELHFGGRYRHERFGYLPDRLGDQIQFSNLATGLYDTTSKTNWLSLTNTGHGEGSFFLGAAKDYSVNLNPPYEHFRDMEFDAYIQDDFHVNKNLVLNLGLRYEAHPAVHTADNLMESFDLKNKAVVLAQQPSWYVAKGYTTQTIIDNLTNLGMVFETPQEAGIPSTMVKNNNFTLGPRFGFAYTLFGGRSGTVVRGAYGRYIFPVPIRNSLRLSSASEPFADSYTQNYDTGAQSPDGMNNYTIRASDPVIAGKNASGVVNSGNANSITPGINQIFINPNFPPNYMTEVNATVEQSFKGSSALRVSWVWTHATNLDQTFYFNNHPSDYVWELNTGTTRPGGKYSATAEGPYDQTLYSGNSYMDQMSGWSDDQQLQASYQRIFHHGLAYQVFYVWSKAFRVGGNWSLDNKLYPFADFAPGYAPAQPSGVPNWGATHDLNRHENYMVDTKFPTQMANFTFVYDLPMGRGKRFLSNSNRFVNQLVGGFELAGDGQMVSQDFAVDSSHYGATSPVHLYKHGAKITDCSSGVCHPAYLWFNGYIAPTVNANSGFCTKNCIEGLPGNYVPYETPINNTPNAPNYGNDNVSVPLAAGGSATVAFSPGPSGANPFSRTILNGPINYNADASLFKVFPITERINLRVNVDFFNVFNIQGYNNPNKTNGVENLLSAYWSPRVAQYTMRLTF